VPVGQSAILNSAKFHDNRKGRYEHKRKTRPKPLKHSATQPQQKTKAFQPRINANEHEWGFSKHSRHSRGEGFSLPPLSFLVPAPAKLVNWKLYADKRRSDARS
jgi:hypothetical protein